MLHMSKETKIEYDKMKGEFEKEISQLKGTILDLDTKNNHLEGIKSNWHKFVQEKDDLI